MSTQSVHSPVLIYSPGACSFGSIVAADWMKQPYRVCKADQQNSIFKKINPRTQVPTLFTSGKVLTESLAILYHFATNLHAAEEDRHRYCFAEGTPEFDQLNEVLSYLVTSFHSVWGPLYHVDRYVEGEEAQEALKKKTLENIRKRYDEIGKTFLKDDTFFAHPTIADAYFYGLARWGYKFFDIANNYHKVDRFMKTMAKDPSVQFALSVEAEKDQNPQGQFEGRVSMQDLL